MSLQASQSQGANPDGRRPARPALASRAWRAYSRPVGLFARRKKAALVGYSPTPHAVPLCPPFPPRPSERGSSATLENVGKSF